jgi:hypothetical protein
MPGSQPVNICAYRHKPELKTGIECQLVEILASRVIQCSTSHLSSPAILVKKNDGTWRLCVDYHCLNSMNVISKYLLELCPRGNNKDVIIIILVHDNVYIPC